MPEILADLKAPHVKKSLISFPSIRHLYNFAVEHVKTHRQQEFDRCWASVLKAKASKLDPHWFLREFLWCTYVSGFSAKTISKKYDALLQAHRIENSLGNYLPADQYNAIFTCMREGGCMVDGYKDVFKIFKNKRKAQAVQIARLGIYRQGWEEFAAEYIGEREPARLIELPGIGPALSCHLARNLGNVHVCKPDVHLKRVAETYGLQTVHELCVAASLEPVGKTDLILWLASVDNGTT